MTLPLRNLAPLTDSTSGIEWEETPCLLCGGENWSPLAEAPDRTAEGIGLAFLSSLSNDATCPEDLVGEAHHDGQILSGALWEIREQIGAERNSCIARPWISEAARRSCIRRSSCAAPGGGPSPCVWRSNTPSSSRSAALAASSARRHCSCSASNSASAARSRADKWPGARLIRRVDPLSWCSSLTQVSRCAPPSYKRQRAGRRTVAAGSATGAMPWRSVHSAETITTRLFR